MERRTFLKLSTGAMLAVGAGASGIRAATAAGKDIVYLTPGLDLPFWRYLSKGIEATVKAKGYGFQALDSHNSAQTQLQNAQDSIARGVAGIVISPTDSSTAPSVLTLAKRAKIPVVIGDIGTNSGDYSSFIISDNYRGAHDVGVALAKALKKKGWEGGSVGIVAISQARKNGQARIHQRKKADGKLLAHFFFSMGFKFPSNSCAVTTASAIWAMRLLDCMALLRSSR